MASDVGQIFKIGKDQESLVKPIQYREDRIAIPPEINSSVNFENFYGEPNTGRLVNISRFGLCFEINDQDSLAGVNTKVSKFVATVGDTQIYSGDVTIVGEYGSKSGSVMYGAVVETSTIDVDQVAAIIDLNSNIDFLRTTKKVLEISELVRPEFKILVADLNTLFQDLKAKLLLEQERVTKLGRTEQQKARLEEHAISLALSLYREEFHKIFSSFKAITDGFSGDETVLHKQYFRANFQHLVEGAPFLNRAQTKPLGYAGDYGLMVMLYEYHDVGKDLFGKFFHRLGCNEPAALANKNRVEYIGDLLIENYNSIDGAGQKKVDPFKITSVACGPAREIQIFLDAVEKRSAPVEIVLIDQEKSALDHATERLKTSNLGKPVRVKTFAEDAVLGIIKERAFVQEIIGSRFIICSGLFDYLSNRVAARLLESLYALVAAGGTLIVGNVSKQNPDRFSMDYFMDWNLILRDANDLRRLAAGVTAKWPEAKVEVASESLGINLFLHITKK